MRVLLILIPRLTKAFSFGVTFQTDPLPPLDSLEQRRNNVLLMFLGREASMLRVFVEEAAALTSIVLFVGMIAVWAQLFAQL